MVRLTKVIQLPLLVFVLFVISLIAHSIKPICSAAKKIKKCQIFILISKNSNFVQKLENILKRIIFLIIIYKEKNFLGCFFRFELSVVYLIVL